MRRRNFVKSTTVAVLGISMLPQHIFAMKEFSKNELVGKGNPLLYGDNINLRKEAYQAFLKMKKEAKIAGIDIKIVSSYRDFYRQKAIYETKYKRFTSQGLPPLESIRKIIEYSTIPGTSRHHWGTDIDIVDANGVSSGDVLIADKFHGNGPFCKLKEWMDAHANTYGFYIVYTDNANRKGFKYEPWHYTYAPTSKPMLEAYTKIDLKEFLIEEQLLGKEYLTDAFITEYYSNNILDINPKLLS